MVGSAENFKPDSLDSVWDKANSGHGWVFEAYGRRA
jgi:hypothetical protein